MTATGCASIEPYDRARVVRKLTQYFGPDTVTNVIAFVVRPTGTRTLIPPSSGGFRGERAGKSTDRLRSPLT